ncbi:SusC/RagA family TonB-linked outer membrane protein [Pedobacter sp. MW01-1-1]|uniref:SusC/RagA family TonB-linked outer membrane protein n=1 Tax=Pedobacter sp. MW01-1-1 TaxID=3383027 RepID=UPI003FED8EFD
MKKQLIVGTPSFFAFYRILLPKKNLIFSSLLLISFSAAAKDFSTETNFDLTRDYSNALNRVHVRFNFEDIKIKGVVKDEGGVLQGVIVRVVGSNVSTQTDAEGRYQITVPKGGTLQFSYVGFATQTITVQSEANINVVLKPDNEKYELNDVVVVGYGTQKRSDITGSVSSVPKERLSQIPVTNVLHAMEGATAGLRITQTSSVPGSSAGVLVRGVNSINANTAPLTVIDGVPFSNLGGSMNDINPNDIESIEILKDASAVAVYGTRGSSGVILITTKRGKSGEPTIRYSGYGGPEFQNKTLTPLNADEYVQKYIDFRNQGKQAVPSPPVPNQYEIENYNAGKTVDWMDEISQQGYIMDHNISISGGTERIKYFVSGAYQKQKGVLKGYQYSRASFRSNIDAKLTNWLTAGTSLFFAANNTDGGKVNYTAAMQMSPYGREFEANGDYTIFPMFSETNFRNPLLGLNSDVINRDKNLNAIFYADVKPAFLKGLKYRVNANFTFLPSRTNTYTGVDAGDTFNGTAAISNAETSSWIVENILTYDKDWASGHHIDVTALYSAQEKEYNTNGTNGRTFINDDLSFNNMAAAAVITANSFYSREALISQMGRINYSYKSKYLLTATARRDGYSAFGSGTNKYGLFPSVAVGWNISKENFLKNVKQINNIKLRASYGKSGNQAVGVYQTITTQGVTKYIYNSVTAIGLVSSSLLANGVLGNVNLNWESTTGTNLALDFALFNNRISGTIEAYQTKTNDVLLSRKLPTITGYASIFDNLGSVKNKGIEFTLNTVNISKSNFTWSTNFNFSANRNKIVSLYGDDKDDVGNKWFIGKPLYAIFDYKQTGIWQVGEDPSTVDPGAVPGSLKFEDTNNDNKITEADKVYQGTSLPKWTGGMINNFRYKQFSLSVFIQTSQGSLINNPLLNLQNYGGRVNIPREVSYWTEENRNNSQPSLVFTNPRLYAYPVNQSYTRLKDVTFSYTFADPVLKKLNLGSLSAFVSGRNLITFTDWVGLDPELSVNANQAGTANAPLSYGIYPLVSSFVFGLNITLR